MKIQSKIGGGSGWGFRVDVNEEVNFCENSKKNRWGSGQGVLDGSEQRIEFFVKIQKKS